MVDRGADCDRYEHDPIQAAEDLVVGTSHFDERDKDTLKRQIKAETQRVIGDQPQSGYDPEFPYRR